MAVEGGKDMGKMIKFPKEEAMTTWEYRAERVRKAHRVAVEWATGSRREQRLREMRQDFEMDEETARLFGKLDDLEAAMRKIEDQILNPRLRQSARRPSGLPVLPPSITSQLGNH